MANDLLVRLTGYTVNAADLIIRLTAATSSLTVDAGAPQTVDPFDTITLAATASVTPDSWLWEQIGGPPVTLTGSGPSRTYVSPAIVGGGSCTFRATATKAGSGPGSATVVHTIYPHTVWAGVGAGRLVVG